MKEIKKYTDIIRYGKKGTEDVLKKGDYITITEKWMVLMLVLD